MVKTYKWMLCNKNSRSERREKVGRETGTCIDRCEMNLLRLVVEELL